MDVRENIIGWLAVAGILSDLEEKHAGKPWEAQLRLLRKEAYRRAVTLLTLNRERLTPQ